MAEKESIPAIVTATIILGIVTFFVTVVICLITGSWCCCNKTKKTYTVELEEHHQTEMTIQNRISNQVSIRILI